MHAACLLHACSIHVCNIHVTCMVHACHMHVPCMLYACTLHVICMHLACHMHAPCMSHACYMHAIYMYKLGVFLGLNKSSVTYIQERVFLGSLQYERRVNRCIYKESFSWFLRSSPHLLVRSLFNLSVDTDMPNFS